MMNLRTVILGFVVLIGSSGIAAPTYAKDTLTQQEAEAEIEAFYADPVRMLRYSYHNYMIVRSCNEARKGLLVQYVNGYDLRKAKDTIRKIQDVLLKKSSEIDVDAVWQESSDRFGDLTMSPFAYVARVGVMNNIYFDLIQSAFQGDTGAKRKAYFENAVRGSENSKQVRSICQTALKDLSKDLVDITSDEPAKVPKKDF